MTAAHRLLLILTLVGLVAAGCLDPSAVVEEHAEVPPEFLLDWAARALPFGDGHDHFDPAQHRDLSTPNFRLLGYDPLVTDAQARSAGGYLCAGAATEGERHLAVVHSLASEVAFVLADVTDPSQPVMVGELVLPGTSSRDVSITPDGMFVVIGANGVDSDAIQRRLTGAATTLPDDKGLGLRGPHFRDACGTVTPVPVGPRAASAILGVEPYPSGWILVDVSTPEAPVIVDYAPLPILGAHSIYATHVKGQPVVLASVVNRAQAAGYYGFYTVAGTGADARIVHESTYVSAPASENKPLLNGHNDGWIHEHPVTGQVLAYLADWDAGLVILDITDIRIPREIGRWMDYRQGDAQDDSGSVHSALPLDALRDGKHYTIIGQEILARPQHTPTGIISILDTTDPANPSRVGVWTLPVDVNWDARLLFSTHYLTVIGDTVFVTMYHGGVWAVDIADVREPRSVGVFLPANESPAPASPGPYQWAPTVMDARALPGGELVVWDSGSGVYVVSFDAGMTVPLHAEWDLMP